MSARSVATHQSFKNEPVIQSRSRLLWPFDYKPSSNRHCAKNRKYHPNCNHTASVDVGHCSVLESVSEGAPWRIQWDRLWSEISNVVTFGGSLTEFACLRSMTVFHEFLTVWPSSAGRQPGYHLSCHVPADARGAREIDRSTQTLLVRLPENGEKPYIRALLLGPPSHGEQTSNVHDSRNYSWVCGGAETGVAGDGHAFSSLSDSSNNHLDFLGIQHTLDLYSRSQNASFQAQLSAARSRHFVRRREQSKYSRLQWEGSSRDVGVEDGIHGVTCSVEPGYLFLCDSIVSAGWEAS